MGKFFIQGGNSLRGEVKISGYKNSAGAILAAALLSEETSTIENVPLCLDILNEIEILKKLGVKAQFTEKNKIKITPKIIEADKLSEELFEKTRISVLLIAPLLMRTKKFKTPHPGGDKIGVRPISTHLNALKKMGIKVKEEGGYYHFEMPKKINIERIVLDDFSVTATEVVMMIFANLEGKRTIELAACEPQVVDLGNFLIKMGAKIEGLGTHTLNIEGKNNLSGAEHKIQPDLLEAGTFLIAFAITKGEGKIKDIDPSHLTMFLKKMKDIGAKFKIQNNEILVAPAKNFFATKIQVLLYPGFLTDLQPQISVLLTQAKGKSLIHDPLYDNRFQYLYELKKMGGDIEITDPHRALIWGKKKLTGSKINPLDIRGDTSLILAGLIAEGETIIENTYHIDRGYEGFDEKLRKIGAKIKRG